ncbi:MAG: DNA-protecting protein DprA [Alicyclobacillaceae bacterium]|nr:DNA-protecting protein DprA [Alicyclobacillaceae bacterium]
MAMRWNERAWRIGLALMDVERTVVRKLVRTFGSATAACEAGPAEWCERARLKPEAAARFGRCVRQMERDGPECWERRLRSRGIRCLVPGDEDYPAALNDLVDPPVALFARGRGLLADLEQTVAVVGTRRASGYGLEAVRWIAEQFARAGLTVVSGMALGVDGEAHRAALEAGGCTTAVLASGPDVCYPPGHKELFAQLCERGNVLTEYPPGWPVAKHRFPERNRLIAALARATVVVQAGERSGALVTADWALELGRDVYVVPGPITSVHFRGSHRLIQQGAHLLFDPLDCLAEWGLGVSRSGTGTAAAPSVPARWVDLYDRMDDACAVPVLANVLGWPLHQVYAGLLELELAGLVERLPGGAYRRCRA